jgi:hypothetical protein
MKDQHTTIKIWRSTLSKLRLLAALKEKSMVSILNELISIELEAIREKSNSI